MQRYQHDLIINKRFFSISTRIQNVIESWINRSVDVNKKIQRLVLPSGILDNPENRQYLTPEVNRLFRITSELSMISEDVKKIPH